MDRREFLSRVLGASLGVIAAQQPLRLVGAEPRRLKTGLQMVPLDSIKIDWSRWCREPYPTEHEMFKELVRSIQEHGVLRPIMVETDSTLIDGVYRIEAARAAGLTEIPAIVRDDLTLGYKLRQPFAGLSDAVLQVNITHGK